MSNDQINPLDALRAEPEQTRSDKLFGQISEMILSGQLESGYMFPNENAMCEQLGVGRSTLREAYKALASFGYVTRSKRGTIVNNRDQIVMAMPLDMTMQHSARRDLLEFRLMLESETARYAATRATAEEIQALENLLEDMRRAYADGEPDMMAALDIAFHQSVAKAAHNQLFEDTMVASADAWESGTVQNFRDAYAAADGLLDKTLSQHGLLISAIKSRDEAMARMIMRTHIELVAELSEE